MRDNSIITGSNILIENYGCSCFLKPPTHPDAKYSIKTDGMVYSISSALSHDNVAVRIIAKKMLDEWKPPKLDYDWVYRCLGYYRHGWRNPNIGDPECWYHCNVLYCEDPIGASYLDHFGVHWIQRFYPDYFPTEKDFKNAYWDGKTALSQSSSELVKRMNYIKSTPNRIDSTAIIPYTGTQPSYDICNRLPEKLQKLYGTYDTELDSVYE